MKNYTLNIFLDSNIIIKDFYLQSAESTLFLNNYSRNGNKCFISKITFFEILKNYQKQLKIKLGKIESNINSIKRQTKNFEIQIPENFIENEIKEYKKFLNEKLKLYKIEIVPLPKISHYEILKHINSEKAPFNESDKGYKDFLIFNSILENIKTDNSDIVFISNDNDFGTVELHSDLKELNLSKRKIKIRKSLNEINKNELRENISIGNAELDFIIEIFHDDNHVSEYLNSVTDYINSKNIEIEPIYLNDYKDLINDEPFIDYFEFDDNTSKIIKVDAINPNLVIVNAEIEGFISHIFTINQKNLHVFRNFPDEYQLEYNIDEDNAIVWIGSHFLIDVRVQSDKDGLDIKNVELRMKLNYYH